MGFRALICALSMTVACLFVGCGNDTQQVQPATRGERGERCQARNDCQSGLACLNGVCAKNDFGLTVLPKQCDRIECAEDTDCCGDKPQAAPKKCNARAETCDSPSIAGCVQTICTSDTTCKGGTCAMGTCSTGGACSTKADCADTCAADGFCTKSAFTACTTNAQCAGTCSTRVCNCQNPTYNPADPICTDPDCKDICLLHCEDELCVKDNSCKVNADCFGVGLKMCDADRCVQCIADEDCDAAKSETCLKGLCKKPCTNNEECPVFDACQMGECVYVGCLSDRECILAASRGIAPGGGAAVGGSEDARLLKCLPSEADPKISTCKVPCENDGSCGSEFEVCDKGYCKFVGCDSNEECRAYLGIENQMTTDAKPFVATAVCRQ